MSAGFRPSPASFVGGPPRYPAPDWSAEALICQVWFPGDADGEREIVGRLVWQDPDRLGWLSLTPTDALGYPIRALVEDALRDGALFGREPREVYDELLERVLHTTPTRRSLAELCAELRHEWGTE